MFKMAWGKQDPQHARYKKKMMKTIWTVIMKYNVSLKTGCKDWICGKGEWQIHDIINHFEQRAHMTAHAQLLRKSHGIAIKRIRAFIYISVIKINLLPQEEFLLSTLQSTPLSPLPLKFYYRIRIFKVLLLVIEMRDSVRFCQYMKGVFFMFNLQPIIHTLFHTRNTPPPYYVKYGGFWTAW